MPQLLLITLCIRCHVRLHHSRRFNQWVPEALLELWRELHPNTPLQLQLPFGAKKDPTDGVGAELGKRKPRQKPEFSQTNLYLGSG
jgi:hypothetical protein